MREKNDLKTAEKLKLIPYVCPKCQTHIVWAPRTATVYCRRCDKWLTDKNLKEANPIEIDPTKDQEQLKLF